MPASSRPKSSAPPPEPVKRVRRNGQATRKRLIDAAIDIMGESGSQAVTVTAAAQRAGITRRAAYHHFSLREGLMLEVHDVLTTKVAKGPKIRLEFADLMRVLIEQEGGALRSGVLRSFVFQMLEKAPRSSALVKLALQSYREMDRDGWLQPGVDPEMAAYVGVAAAYLGAALAAESSKSAGGGHLVAQRFIATLRQFMYSGLLREELRDVRKTEKSPGKPHSLTPSIRKTAKR